jgi:hypothetical protein
LNRSAAARGQGDQPRSAAGHQSEEHGERLVVIEHQWRQPVSAGKPVPAVAAAHRFDGYVEVAQVLHDAVFWLAPGDGAEPSADAAYGRSARRCTIPAK